MGWFILSENKEGDKEEECRRSGGVKGIVIFDYVIVDSLVREKTMKQEVLDFIDSYHFPKIQILEEETSNNNEDKKEVKLEIAERGDYSIKRKEKLWKKVKNIEIKKENVNEGTSKKEFSEEGGRNGWDEECEEKKKVWKVLRKWRKGESSGQDHKRKRKKCEMCDQ